MKQELREGTGAPLAPPWRGHRASRPYHRLWAFVGQGLNRVVPHGGAATHTWFSQLANQKKR